MLYNVPSRSGVDITPAVLSYLAEHKNLWALKEASGSIDNFLQYRQSNHDTQMFSGEDGLMSHLTALGATGVVSLVANVCKIR
jgi:4-hydroxy-tetrahydrodipicolinate synthase